MIGIRNILRYAPLYYPDYRIEINNGSQFIFSITYMDKKMTQTGQKCPRQALKMTLTKMDLKMTSPLK